MKRRTPPRAEKTAFAASPDVGEHLNSDAKTPRGLNQNRRRPRQKATCCATPRTSGQVERPESPRMRESIRLSPKRRGKACRNVARKLAASRKRTPARPFCGHAARGRRQSGVRPGIRHIQAALLSGADCARKPTGPTRRAGGRAPLLHGRSASAQSKSVPAGRAWLQKGKRATKRAFLSRTKPQKESPVYVHGEALILVHRAAGVVVGRKIGRAHV